jgi:hypothetical protein
MARHAHRFIALVIVAALAGTSAPTLAQTDNTTNLQGQSVGERLRGILGNILNNRSGNNSTLEAQWASGRRPLSEQRYEFESRVDTEVRNRALSYADGERIKSDYRALVDLEARYAGDGQIDSNERRDLSSRYTALTEALQRGSYGGAGGGYQGGYGNNGATVAQGEQEFRARVDAQLNNRRISRTEASRLRSDYAALIRLEEQYLRDGYLDDGERRDLDERLDALDARLGDAGYGSGGYGNYGSPRQRLDAISAAVSRSGLSTSAQVQVRTEVGDLMRLESAYARLSPTADDRAYLEQRISALETRVRIRR